MDDPRIGVKSGKVIALHFAGVYVVANGRSSTQPDLPVCHPGCLHPPRHCHERRGLLRRKKIGPTGALPKNATLECSRRTSSVRTTQQASMTEASRSMQSSSLSAIGTRSSRIPSSTFLHPFVGELVSRLNRQSLSGMLNATWQGNLRWSQPGPLSGVATAG